MDTIYTLLLLLTVSLSAGRNLLSKRISDVRMGEKPFFGYQAALFFVGGVLLVAVWLIGSPLSLPALSTLGFAAAYAATLLLAQWCYTASFAGIDLAICSTVYSFGFILPTLSGAALWGEPLTLFDGLGLVAVLAAIVLSGVGNKADKTSSKKYFIPLLLAMLASGGLGLIQKFQQKSAYRQEREVFVAIAFLLAASVSFVASLFAKKKGAGAELPCAKKQNGYLFAALTGLCFGACNLLDTTLAGSLDSSLFFPLKNIGVILLSIVVNAVLSQRLPSRKSCTVFGLGVVAILLLNL